MMLIEALDTYTVDLVLDGDKPPPPRGRASGLILAGRPHPILLTAGHILDAGDCWYLERPVAPDKPAILIPLHALTAVLEVSLGSPDMPRRLDVAWAVLDDQTLKPSAKVGKPAIGSFELPIYAGPLDGVPVSSTTYAFLAHNRSFFDDNLLHLIREPSYEFGMKYEGRSRRNGMYRFRLANGHQGHHYYEGASGAPIADETGMIVSIVVSGCPEDDLLYGFPLAEYAGVLGL